MEKVKVTLRVELGDNIREFAATAEVLGDGIHVAAGMVGSLHADATEWLQATKQRRRTSRFRPRAAVTDDPNRRTAVNKVYDLVAAGVTSTGEIQRRSGYSETAVRNALAALVDAGRVHKLRHGRYAAVRAEDGPTVAAGEGQS